MMIDLKTIKSLITKEQAMTMLKVAGATALGILAYRMGVEDGILCGLAVSSKTNDFQTDL